MSIISEICTNVSNMFVKLKCQIYVFLPINVNYAYFKCVQMFQIFMSNICIISNKCQLYKNYVLYIYDILDIFKKYIYQGTHIVQIRGQIFSIIQHLTYLLYSN